MNVPAPPSQFFPPPFAASGDSVGFWPQNPFDNEQSEAVSAVEYPPFKKPRNSEDFQSNNVSNPPPNPRMPPLNPPVIKGVGRIFFKTRLCAKFKANACPYGKNCNFAHGIEDIRMPPPNWQEIVAAHSHEEDRPAGNWDEDQRIISRMKICKRYYNGEECPYGERCSFLHEDPGRFREDLGRFRESSAISIGTTGSPGSNGSGSDQSESNGFVNSNLDASRVNLKPVFWKTRICIKWETTGNCPFGEKCHFAHGQAELQKFGEKVYVIGEDGILKELELAGFQYLGGPEDGGKKIELKPGFLMEHDENVGAVVVGFDRYFNYYKIQYGTLCIRENPGCLFIATNRDAVTHLTDAQEWAGGGSMVGAISGSTQREPLVVGKPSTFMMDYLSNKFGILKSQICMVGDRLDTDILFGQNGGCKTLLVLSGVTSLSMLQSPKNSIQPDFYTNKISDFLALKAAAV